VSITRRIVVETIKNTSKLSISQYSSLPGASDKELEAHRAEKDAVRSSSNDDATYTMGCLAAAISCGT
jgi:hypothetical protein